MKNILVALAQVFGGRRYLIAAVLIAVAVFIFMVLLPNWRLVAVIIGSSSVSWFERFFIIAGIAGSAGNIFGVYYSVYIVLVSILFGVNSTLVFYYLGRQNRLSHGGGVIASASGLATGILGVGCTACGSIALSPLLALIGAGGIAAFLPLGGKEFSVVGIILLILSMFLIVRKINQPAVCKIK